MTGTQNNKLTSIISSIGSVNAIPPKPKPERTNPDQINSKATHSQLSVIDVGNCCQ